MNSICIEDGKICEVTDQNIDFPDPETIDAQNNYVFRCRHQYPHDHGKTGG